VNTHIATFYINHVYVLRMCGQYIHKVLVVWLKRIKQAIDSLKTVNTWQKKKKKFSTEVWMMKLV